MRIVKISELSEEQKKKIKERQQERQRISEQNRINVNNQFNELIAQKGEYNKTNKTSLWDNIQNLASDTGKAGNNLWQGMKNGVISLQQTLGRNMFNIEGRKKEAETFDKLNREVLEKQTKGLSREEKQAIYENYENNPFNYSNIQRNLINSIEEKNEELQEKKNKNTLKIQQNAESMNTEIGKYIAGEIAPGIGQMLPGMVGGPIGTTYFIGSATGNYYDDAKQRGMTEDQATMYSGVMGIIEGSLEAVGAKLTTNVGKQLLKKNIKGALINYGLDIGENFLEESIVEPISEIMATTTAGKEKADWSNIGQRMWQSGVAGAITSAITGGTSAVIGGVGSKVSQQNKYVDYKTNKKLDTNSQNILKQAENIIQENNTIKLEPQSTQNTQNTPSQQVMPMQQENAQNAISKQTKTIANNQEMNYTNVESESGINGGKQDNIKQRGILPINETMRGQEQGRNTTNIENIEGQDIGSRVFENNIPQKTIEQQYTDTEKIKETINYANKNRIKVASKELIEVQNKAKELGLNLIAYNGAKGNEYLGLIDNSNVYLDVNKNNISAEDGSLMDRFSHEILHYIKRNTSFNNTINEIQDKILAEHTESINNFVSSKGYDSSLISDNFKKAISEEILGDYSAKYISKYDVDYGLPEDIIYALNTTIDDAIVELKLKNNKYSQSQEEISANLPTNESNIATILEKPVEKVHKKVRSGAIIKANLIDKGMVFEELSRKTGNRDLQGKWDYTLTSTARGQNAIGNARYELDPNTKTQKQISKSLTDIIDEVGEDTADFYSYMYHQLNIDRMTLEERFSGDTGINYERRNTIMNKPVFGESVTAQMSRQKVAELEKKHPEFKDYAQDVYDYLDANTKELVDNGVISKETQQLFKDMYPHYVPISRVRNNGQAINVPLDTGKTGINNPIKKATGGSSDINPLFETIADRTLQTYRATARNSFGVELKNTINKTKQLNQMSEQTDIDTIVENITDEEQNKQLLKEGENGENPTFTVFENGNKVTYEISDEMYDALKPQNELLTKFNETKTSKVLNSINNFRRGLLTEYNPIFSITNAIKDSQDILLNSQHSAKTYIKIPEATAQILSKGYWYNEYIQNGGEQNSYFTDGEFETKKTLPTKIKNTITFPLRAISNVNNIIEMTPRLAEYIASREQGRSIETSMLDASRVTTNFKAGGDITKALNRNGFTFLNASVQGMQQQIRNVQEANAKGLKGYAVLACKYAIAGAPVLLLNNLLWADDDEYKELQDYVKDNYYIIGKLPNGKFLRIPKGRAVATIQKIVSNVNDFVKNDSINSDEVGKIFWKDMKENVQFGIDNLAPNNPLENNVISPIFQAITNKTWYGEDLVPTRLQNKPKEEQYDETTDSFSRWLGEKTGVSPIKINYLIDQYSGGVGDVLLPLGTPQAENNAIEDKFTTDSIMKSKYPGEFFTKVDELEINSNSSKATDEDIIKYKYISSVSSEVGKLYKKKRDIQNSNATDEKKKAQLKEVQKQINELAKKSLENVDKITKGEKYAQIDTSQYYKDVEGEWNKVSDKDKEKNKKLGLSLKSYSSYKYEMSKVKEQKVNNGEMTKDQSLKSNDKIQILLDSNYSDKEKTAIYENYIKTQTKEGEYDSFDVIKASNIDIDEYLKFQQQDFVSDKKEDGTLDGKTVSNSKKQKVVNYINSMKIEGNQRLLLYAMQGYGTTSSQKSQLAQYVHKLKLNKNTKLELYNKFSGFRVYKDGRVQW